LYLSSTFARAELVRPGQTSCPFRLLEQAGMPVLLLNLCAFYKVSMGVRFSIVSNHLCGKKELFKLFTWSAGVSPARYINFKMQENFFALSCGRDARSEELE
jgi:hypothetical protein